MLSLPQSSKFAIYPKLSSSTFHFIQFIKTLFLQENFNQVLCSSKSLQDLIPFLSFFKFSTLQKVLAQSMLTIPQVSPSSSDFQRIFLLYIECLLNQNLFYQAYQAIQFLEINIKSLKINHHFDKFLLCLGICLRGLKYTDASLKYFDQLIDNYKTRGTSRDIADVYLQKALTYQEKGNSNQAMECLMNALEIYKADNIQDIKVIFSTGVVEREIGKLCFIQGKIQDSLDYLQTGLEKLETCVSRDNPEIAKTLMYLGEVYLELGRDEEGFETCQEASIYLRKCYELDSAYIAESYYALGKAFMKARKLDLAEEHFLKALKILKRFYRRIPMDYLLFAKLNLALADIKREVSKNKEALGLYNQCFSILKAWLRTPNQTHPLYIQLFEGLGKIYMHEFNFSEALKAFESALEITQKQENQSQYYEALMRIHIAQIFFQQASIKKASESLERGIKILRKEVGEENHLMAESYILQGQVLQALGRIHDAQQTFIKGVMLTKKIYKSDNYRLWKFHYHIGITYMMQGKLRNAINSLLKSLKLVKNFSGSRSKELMSIYFRLGDIYFEQNKKSQALENYKNGLEIECKGNLNESEKYECQGKMLLSEGKGEKALEKFQDCLNHKMKLLGKAHPDLSECYLQIAKAYAHEEKYQEALQNLKQGQEVIEKHFGDSNVNLYLVHQCAGKVYMKKSMYKESFESYHKSLVIIKKAFGNKNSIMGEIYRDFATMYRNQGKFDSALVYLKMATDMQQTTWNREHLKVFVSSFNLGCLYGSIGHYDIGIKHLEGSKMSLDKAKCQHEIKEENVEKKIALLKKKLALSRSLDC